MPEPFAWTPPTGLAENSNAARFMRRHKIADERELIRRSTADIAWFWDAIVAELGIEFSHPYERVVDASAGIAWAKWFVGGRLNLAHNCLDRHARPRRRDKLAVIWEGEDGAVRRLTYGELHAETNRLAHALRRLGVGRGDRVGLFLPMTPEAVMGLLACAKLGAIAIPIFSGFGPEAVAVRLQDGAAKVLLTADGFFRRGSAIDMKAVADEATRLSPTVEHTLVFRRLGREAGWRPGFDRDWHEAAAREPADFATEEMDAEDPFLLIYTSGTTGRPKGAVHVHGGFLVKIAQEVAFQVDLQEADRLYWSTDMGWIMGPWEVVGALALGGTIVLAEGAPDFPGPDRVWATVERHGVSILGLSPTLIRSLMKHGEGPVRAHDLSGLRVLASTGEPWNLDPWRWYFEVVGDSRCPVVNFSGGTEVGACFLSPLPTTPLKPCSLGGPALGMDVDVVDAAGDSVRGGVGELVCRQPWPGMTRGLWGDPDRYLETYWSRWPGLWCHGDWASVDADGRWFLHGRSDDTLNVAGKRIGPAEFESALVGHPAVAEAAAIGVPDRIKGEVVLLFAVLRPGFAVAEGLEPELRACISRVLGKAFAPDRVHVVSELPRTRNGKILRRALRAAVLGLDAGDLSSLENPSSLVEAARVGGRGIPT